MFRRRRDLFRRRRHRESDIDYDRVETPSIDTPIGKIESHVVKRMMGLVMHNIKIPIQRLVVYPTCGQWSKLRAIVEEIIERNVGGAFISAFRHKKGETITIMKNYKVLYKGIATDWCHIPSTIIAIKDKAELENLSITPEDTEVYLVIVEEMGRTIVPM